MPTSTAVIRESFERELVEDNRRDPNTLRRYPDGSYLYLRVQQDWLLYERAWHAATEHAAPKDEAAVAARAFWAEVKGKEANGDHQSAWASVTERIKKALMEADYAMLTKLTQAFEPEQHDIETVASAVGFFIMGGTQVQGLAEIVLRAQKHFADAPHSAAKVVLMQVKVA